MLAAMVAATVEVKTVEREWHLWNEGSSCAEIHG